MLDIKFIRDNPELIKEAARKKHISFDVKKLLKVDEERVAVIKAVDGMRAEQNAANEKIARAGSDSERRALIEEMRAANERRTAEEAKLEKVMLEWRLLMLQVPNVPDMSVPEGEDDSANEEVRAWGEKPAFDFEPKSHGDLMTALNMVDFERGAKVAGFRGYFLKNDGVQLTFALWRFAVDHFLAKEGFVPLIAPSRVRREPFLGTGYLPQGEEDLYKTQDGDYLAGTAEVPVMGSFMDDVFARTDLPVKVFAFSPCFRREAGSHGKDTKGLMRVHEFFKFEQVVLCEARHEESAHYHEWINRNTEEAMEKLGIPYRTVINSGGDLGLGQVKKYDIELWVPSEKRYREISSASYFHDFQTRRLNIRYRDNDGKLRFAHSLNSTALPTPRLLIAVVENNQNKDGSIRIPEALWPYFGKKVIEAPLSP
ncbi:MAG: serine--tRNA ligase [Parcubacteria group bacterium]|nr:serine--tRNA ligase [Parcubacteria group bacterium]